MCADFQMIVT